LPHCLIQRGNQLRHGGSINNRHHKITQQKHDARHKATRDPVLEENLTETNNNQQVTTRTKTMVESKLVAGHGRMADQYKTLFRVLLQGWIAP
jgi:uncharacterized Fe-S center protein